MSEAARKEFHEARVEQTTRNDARRIRTRVEAAQKNHARAGVRWPFELLQNAHDAGPRSGDDYVNIGFVWRGDNLSVSHTGDYFTAQELAALLSGGSSKEYDSEETTGRFGTGFLVTHGLSPHVNVKGVLSTQGDIEYFDIKLVRDGDEDSIAHNIELSEKALSDAKSRDATWIASNPTALFNYHDVNSGVARKGLERLQQSLPYLYATCKKLGRVDIECLNEVTVFERGNTHEYELDEFRLQETEVIISGPDKTKHQITAIRIGKEDAALLVVIDNSGDRNCLVLPRSEFPKLFVRFPIAGTDRLKFKVVLDGQFTPEQERDGILMNQDDEVLISSALAALPSLVRRAVESEWIGAHKLAHLALPRDYFTDKDSEKEWWKDVVLDITGKVAAQPIITTRKGRLSAIHGSDVDAASFLIASFNMDEKYDIECKSIYELAATVNGLHIPDVDIAQDWDMIARDWYRTGVDVKRLGFTELAGWVKNKSQNMAELPIAGDAFIWLAKLLNLAGELSGTLTMDAVLNGLIPNQHSKLCGLRGLHVDGGISKEIKDIAHAIGWDLRSELLHTKLYSVLAEPQYRPGRSWIDASIGTSYTESDAINEILDRLDEILKDDKKSDSGIDIQYLRAASRLAVFLCKYYDSDTQLIRRCPLLTADGTIVRLSSARQILAPVNHWPQTSKAYNDLYPKERLLADDYSDDEAFRQALQPLIDTGIVIESPLYYGIRTSINDINLLDAIVADKVDVKGVTVPDQTVGQIAFLPTELIQRCGRDKELAKLLLDFVINVAAREDGGWREFCDVTGTREREQIDLHIRKAIWPFELKIRPWVPVQVPSKTENQEKGGAVALPANESNLRDDLLDLEWLSGNHDAQDLLHEVFGFSRLTLMLDTLEPEKKTETEGDLVELLRDPEVVKLAIQNPEAVKLISKYGPDKVQDRLEELERQAQMANSNRKFGVAAQEALAEAIRAHGLELELVDKGYDYEVFPGSLDGDLEDAPFSFMLGSYFLEIKASTTGDVRLTPLQAQTASEYPRRFVLCVIDLRGQKPRESWKATDIAPYARIITEIGDDIVEVYEGVDAFTANDIPVRLRNEQELRYGISTDLWEKGMSIDEWVRYLKDSENAC